MAAPTLSPQLHADLSARLESQLDQLDEIAEAKSVISKALTHETKKLRGSVALTRRYLKGLDAPQLEMAGMASIERTPPQFVQRILSLAGRPDAAPARAKDADPLSPLVGTREEAVKRAAATKKGGRR